MFVKLFAASVLLPLVWAFSDTTPLVVWSTQKTTLVEAFSASKQPHIGVLLGNDDLCGFDVVVVIDQPGLHANDLKTLSPSSAVPLRLENAHTSLQLPYACRDTSAALVDSVNALALRCGSKVQWNGLERELDLDTSSKHVLHITLPSVTGEGVWRKYTMTELESSFANSLKEVESAFPNPIFIYTGSEKPGYNKRQSVVGDSIDLPFSFAAANETSSSGILQNYQLLTPGLIISLLVTFFLLVPIIMLAVQALASIQSSVRLDAPKAPSQDKKVQ